MGRGRGHGGGTSCAGGWRPAGLPEPAGHKAAPLYLRAPFKWVLLWLTAQRGGTEARVPSEDSRVAADN